MQIINVLAALPAEVKGNIEQTVFLRINNDEPGLFIPKCKIDKLKDDLKKYESDESVKEFLKLIQND